MAKKIIKAQMKQRSDTMANWAAQNPVLLAGELGIVSDDPNLYKVGNGILAWNALPFRGFDGNIVHTPGTSANAVMSQLAVTEAIEDLRETTNIFIEDLQNTKIDKENDDYYPSMSVGVADHLAGHDDPTPSEFTFRKSGGGAILSGNARVQSVKGNSVVWNQQFNINNIVNNNADLSVSDGTITATMLQSALDVQYGGITCILEIPWIIGHKYIITFDEIRYSDNITRITIGNVFSSPQNAFLTNGVIYKTLLLTPMSSSSMAYINAVGTFAVGDTFSIKNLRWHDLTQMFGAGNEPQTIDDFYSRIPQGIDMNAYNEGEVIHMNVDAVKSVGFNQWDEEWESGGYNTTTGNKEESANFIRTKNLIHVIGGQSYYITRNGKTCYAWLYDSEQKFIRYTSVSSSNVLSIPSNCAYIGLRLGSGSAPVTTYNHDICINSSDTEKNGTYEPYISRMQSLEILRKYFPNGMKSAGTAHDVIRYNKATQKWEAVKRIGEVDMGELTYDKSSIAENAFHTTDLQPIVRKESKNILSAKFVSGNDAANNGVMSNDINGTMYFNLAPYTDVASFKAAMQGVMLYYELANPIVTEIEEAFNLDYEVYNGGTEQAIADTPTSAFKADIIYGFNAYGVIKELREQIATLQAAIAKMNV